MATAIVVVLVVAAMAAANALLWMAVVLWFRRRRTASLHVIADETIDSSELTLRGPERAACSGGSGPYATISGNGFLRLTDRRLLFLKLTGGRVDIERSQIVGVREEQSFLGKVHHGRRHVVVTTDSGLQVGFVVADSAGWVELLRAELNPVTD